ncbi:hypothetical protein LWE61_07080 [Sphingobium sufflavum]|uniref:hypothetical protein n=1 Tax=Sphingobium sufflavum TaxID=1129547 RepID=UPI001F259D21|nr:hypothetical protein [Sphingobium sufflavum]MCE7796323.1 hypothetical protein [Sphingobium sufflavum]
MLRTPLIAGFVALAATLSAPAAFAQAAAAAPAAAAAYSVGATDIGTLLDNPATKAVIDKYLPGFSGNPQIDMARSMTLEQVQGFAPDQISADSLAKINADLAKVPAKK